MSDDSKTRQDGTAAKPAATRSRSEKDVGHALRSVYARTVDEDVPSELLDLLGKLS